MDARVFVACLVFILRSLAVLLQHGNTAFLGGSVRKETDIVSAPRSWRLCDGETQRRERKEGEDSRSQNILSPVIRAAMAQTRVVAAPIRLYVTVD